MHQSAKDGYRAYLQSYASYSLKKIFDINALDLAKVGKAFGFSVPPRVNVSMGGGKSSTSKSGKKRARDEDDDKEELSMSEGELEGDEDGEHARARDQVRIKGKQRRVETLGQKKVDKEVYRNRRPEKAGEQWSR